MAGNKLSPRQKMISLMYLVLMALLALNVSKDILNAFVLVNDGLEKTTLSYNQKNEVLYNSFDEAKLIDKKKVMPSWKKAQLVKSTTKTLMTYIETLKSKLIQETEGLSKEQADTLALKNVNNKDNYDAPTHLMIGQSEDGSTGLARALKEELDKYKSEMINLFNSEEQQTLNLDIETSSISSDEGIQNWEIANFYHTPLAATITLLSKIQTDVKNSEYEVVNKLLQSIGKRDFKFDTIAAKIIPHSNYVLLGEKYDADVFVAAFSTTQDPEILIGKYDSTTNSLASVSDTVPVNKGMGNYSVPTNREGIFKYEGLINLTSPTGEVMHYPFRSEYIVARPSLVVSPDAMNVFYIGPKNPVSISVPGVASENLTATISGTGNTIKKIVNGKYEVKLSKNSPRDVKVSVSARVGSGDLRNMGQMSFVARKLPLPIATIGGKSGEFSVRRAQLKGYSTVRASYGKDFVFTGLPLNVVSYTVEVTRNGNQVFVDKSMRSKNLSEKTKAFFKNKVRAKDKIYITNIKVKDVNNERIGLGGMQITVKQ